MRNLSRSDCWIYCFCSFLLPARYLQGIMSTITFKSQVGSLDYLSMHYLEVSPAALKKIKDGLKSRWICSVNEKLSFQCGMMPLGKGGAFIMLSKKRMKELNIKLHDK